MNIFVLVNQLVARSFAENPVQVDRLMVADHGSTVLFAPKRFDELVELGKELLVVRSVALHAVVLSTIDRCFQRIQRVRSLHAPEQVLDSRTAFVAERSDEHLAWETVS